MSLTNAVLTKIETTNVNAEDIDMTKNIRLLRQIFGRTRRDISPLAFSVAVVEHLMYREECATEDIKVMKDVYPVVAQEFGKSLNSTAANIERLTRKCWEKMVTENTVALYLGKTITERPATKQMLCCLATLSRTGNTYFSDSVDSERAEAEKIVEKLLADGMSANELLEKLKSIQRGGKSSEPET